MAYPQIYQKPQRVFGLFIRNYGIINKRLTSLLKKDQFQWGEEAEEAFQRLKLAMTTTPVLALPNFQEPFILETNDCNHGRGAVLMQGRRPIAFFSKALYPQNQNLSVYEKELLAITAAVDKWRHYLEANSFVIKTDHYSLEYLLQQKLHT